MVSLLRYQSSTFSCYSRSWAFFFFSSRRRHTRFKCDWSSDVCSSDLRFAAPVDADWARARDAVGLGDGGDAAMALSHCLEVNALTLDGAQGAELTAHWSWAAALVTEGEVRDLAQRWFVALEELVRHAGAAGAGGARPA